MAPHTPRPRLVMLGALLAALSWDAGCAAEVKRVDEEPVAGAYTIAFPSVAAAVATEKVAVDVFDVSGGETCAVLMSKRRSNQTLPTAIESGHTAASPCELLAAAQPPVELAFGRRAFIAVASRGGAELLIGCAIDELARESAPRTIALTPFSNTVSLPPTECTSLAQRCSGGC